jgi:hypothetical protein
MEEKESKIALARELYLNFHARCFWHMRKDAIITEDHLPLIIQGLRHYGGREGFLLAAKLCH